MAICLTLVAVAGCSSDDSGPAPAATVNGTDITMASIQKELQAEVDVATKAKTSVPEGLYSSGGDKTTIKTTDGKHTFSATAASSKLTNRILDRLLADELARLKVTVTKANRTAAETTLCQDSPGCLDDYPASFKALLIEQQARLEAYKGAQPSAKATGSTDAELLTEAQKQFEAALATDPANVEQLCFVASQFPDQASADSIKAQVEAGGDLTALTATVPGAQAGQSGEQCPLLSTLSQSSAPAELQDAQAGAVLVVPDTDTGTSIVVKVTQRRQATFDQIKDELVAALKQQETSDRDTKTKDAVKTAIEKVAKKAKVTVDPMFGRWDAAKLQVVPPAAATTTTTAPAAGTTGSTGDTAPAGSTPDSTAPATAQDPFPTTTTAP